MIDGKLSWTVVPNTSITTILKCPKKYCSVAIAKDTSCKIKFSRMGFALAVTLSQRSVPPMVALSQNRSNTEHS